MDALAALRLQIEWGADEALDEAPVDRTRADAQAGRSAAPAPQTMQGEQQRTTLAAPASRPAAAAILRPGAAARARETAQAAPNLDALRAALAAFTECPLAATATNLVFADGNPEAGIVLVGEAPGAEEDLTGRPFAGPAGDLLDKMLASIGLDRTKVLLTCLIPWRPPGNRPVTDLEVQTCLPFLLRHLALTRPRIIVALGQLPARALTGRDETIRRMRGRWHETSIDEREVRVPTLSMLNPRSLLGTPLSKREAWADLLTLRTRLDQQ